MYFGGKLIVFNSSPYFLITYSRKERFDSSNPYSQQVSSTALAKTGS